jgi:hypothetical protein
MRALGDPRSEATILRSISNHATGKTPVRGEMWVVLTLLERQAALARAVYGLDPPAAVPGRAACRDPPPDTSPKRNKDAYR